MADDKLVGGRVDELVRLYLDEEPLLPSVPSRAVGPDDELDDLVVKPRGEMGGEGVVIWRDADGETRERVRARIGAEPGGWIGQELVQLSVHPTVVDGRARAAPRRPAPVRAAVRRRRARAAGRLQPGGARARLDGGEQRAGRGAKDTWVPGR